MNHKLVLQDPLVQSILATWPGAVITMKEPNVFEIEGMMEAGAVGGEYLDAIGKTDLATLTPDEYMGFVEKVIRTYEERCMLLYCGPDGDMPFPPAN